MSRSLHTIKFHEQRLNSCKHDGGRADFLQTHMNNTGLSFCLGGRLQDPPLDNNTSRSLKFCGVCFLTVGNTQGSYTTEHQRATRTGIWLCCPGPPPLHASGGTLPKHTEPTCLFPGLPGRTSRLGCPQLVTAIHTHWAHSTGDHSLQEVKAISAEEQP